MKKKSSPLSLKKIKVATISALQQHGVNKAFTAECPSGFATCATCGRTCGTRLC